jgi:outer membrane lipoprotein SlyB
MRLASSLLVGALLLSGCSHPSSDTYSAADVGRTIETTEAQVIASRIVRVAGDTNAPWGPLAGGALGAAGTGLVFDKGLAAVIGGVIGAGAGYLAQQQVNNREGIEYMLRMDDGRTVTLVQNRAAEEQPLPDGTPVLVQISGQYTRVIADPRPDRASGGGWVDPDTLPPSAPSGPQPQSAPSSVPSAPVPLTPVEGAIGQGN